MDATGWVPYFRQHDPPGRYPGVCWTAELRDGADCVVPGAVAYLSDFRGTVLDCMMLDYLWVPDHYRRRGMATRLVACCRARWPQLELTDPISAAGAALLESLEAERTKP